jgi:hypothetical protein
MAFSVGVAARAQSNEGALAVATGAGAGAVELALGGGASAMTGATSADVVATDGSDDAAGVATVLIGGGGTGAMEALGVGASICLTSGVWCKLK